MQDPNESFDLPRWQTQVDPISSSSSAQAAHGAQASYLYSGPPPPPPHALTPSSPQRIQPLHQNTTGPSRQPRISQLLEQEHAIAPPSSQFAAGPQTTLSRSTSLGGANANNIASRIRRHPQPDDIEAFSADTNTMASSRQTQQVSQNSFYSPSVGYQGQSISSNPSTTSPPDSYNDMYYNGSTSHPPKRLQDATVVANRSGRSPHRGAHTPNSTGLLDPYAQQSQYSPTSAAYSYGSAPPLDRAQSSVYQTHSRTNSQLKAEASTPPIPPYGSQNQGHHPLRQITTNILDTYRICNPAFRYESTHNPRRVLTKPSKPVHNDGFDNEDFDYILYVNDWLGTEEGHKYLILDILGQGTFGQVVKCQNMKTHEIVAVKVVKNKPAYFNQSMMEVTILEMLNKTCDPNDEHHILRLRDSFIHRSHLCLVFELLSSNLYELIKQNQFQGLSTQLVKVFMGQLLDALTVLKEARLIHCDLKPENILLKSLQSPGIKVIDFGSACHERQTVYTYIQSRFYRSPEVLLGMSYTAAIDMWSLGCIAVELFLGLPLFPGTSEYNQLTRIIEMLGMPPQSMLNLGKQTNQKLNHRAAFIDFCKGLLDLNPITRWTPQQARFHPFITGEKFTKPFVPDNMHITAQRHAAEANAVSTPATDPKRPYGGLVPAQSKGARAYPDAATYNHHLAQHQAYTAAQASQAATTFRNPYINPQNVQQQQQHAPPQQSSNASYSSGTASESYQPSQSQGQQYSGQYAPPVPGPPAHHTLPHPASSGQLSSGSSAASQYPTHSSNANIGAGGQLSGTSGGSYYPNQQRARATTVNQMDSGVPPALARLQHMNQDIIGGRNALTPVLNRDDAMREWERRQSGKPPAAQPYQPLEYLQQQAELVGSGGAPMNWNNAAHHARYQAAAPSKLQHSYQPHTIMVDDDSNGGGGNSGGASARRDVVMQNVRAAARSGDSAGAMYSGSAVPAMISSPPQAYTGSGQAPTSSGTRYTASYGQPTHSSSTGGAGPNAGGGYDYMPMGGEQYQGYSVNTTGGASRHVPANTGQPAPPSFYGAGVVPAGAQQQRNPFNIAPEAQPKDTRWQR
ncbi:CMGC/DYRK/YAK protein kinase [Ephemerocybe angulata]|uniref:CMGC/DYRK/YAK protein kinase n=1 Tax=Ephemerocybe angulata TaxID=980116 RepID=A0A8H6MES0_9AGAR|nr:CMGC/DYRK/YAK protein kinase [Tulosesus angulatus]